MAGKGHSPAASGADSGDHDPVERGIHERWSRRRLLHLLLVATLVLSVVAVVGTAVETLRTASAFPVWHIVGNLGFLALLALLVLANQKGHTLLASWVFCGALVLNGSEFFPLPELDRTLALYAAPILVAAVLIRPAAAFEVFALSFADYVIAYVRHAATHPFNWVSLLILFGFSVAAWLAARRAAWFEESEEMYRLELDRVVADLDALQDRWAMLITQLESDAPSPSVVGGRQLWGPAAEGVGVHASEAWRLTEVREQHPRD